MSQRGAQSGLEVTYACAIAPLDQSVTSLGWYPGSYTRNPCPALDACSWSDPSIQFLADPGTPVVVPFPVVVESTSPLILRPNFELSTFFRTLPSRIRVDGVVPAITIGPADKGALLGRIAPRSRGTKWSLWDGRAQAQFIDRLFRDVGLEPVGGARPDTAGFRLTPVFGGHLLARAGGPADCAAPSGLHALRGYLGVGIAPAGYVEPSSGPYARYGTSAQSDATPPRPEHQNVSLPRAAAAGGGGLLILGVLGLGAWWLSRG